MNTLTQNTPSDTPAFLQFNQFESTGIRELTPEEIELVNGACVEGAMEAGANGAAVGTAIGSAVGVVAGAVTGVAVAAVTRNPALGVRVGTAVAAGCTAIGSATGSIVAYNEHMKTCRVGI